ncbi:hypothetical protein [uncultured Ilyobacter sp.]|nr:hypothetical protein [uncultured Ilyobacter sp.]
MGILKLSLYLTIMLVMASYFRKKAISADKRSPVVVKITKAIMK